MDNIIENASNNSIKEKKADSAKKPFMLMAAYIFFSHLLNIVIQQLYNYFVKEPVEGSSFIGGEVYLFADITSTVMNVITIALLILFACLAYKEITGRVKFVAAASLSSTFALILKYLLSLLVGTIYMLVGDIGDYDFMYGVLFQMILTVFDIVVQIPLAIAVVKFVDKRLEEKTACVYEASEQNNKLLAGDQK